MKNRFLQVILQFLHFCGWPKLLDSIEYSMSRFLRVGKKVIHIPSLANVHIGTNCFGIPFLSIYYHNQKLETIAYRRSEWEMCEADFIRIKNAMKEVEKILGTLSMIEETVQTPLQVPLETDRIKPTISIGN